MSKYDEEKVDDVNGFFQGILARESSQTFPILYSYMPRFWATCLLDKSVQRDPITLSPHQSKYDEKWILVFGNPSLVNTAGNPQANASVANIFAKAPDFALRNCQLFLLSPDSFAVHVSVRDSMDIGSVVMVTDPERYVSSKLNVLLSDGPQQLIYPSYFLFSPDRELVAFCVLRNTNDLVVNDNGSHFSYPFTLRVLDNLVRTISDLEPIHDVVVDMQSRNVGPNKVTFSYIIDLIKQVPLKNTNDADSV